MNGQLPRDAGVLSLQGYFIVPELQQENALGCLGWGPMRSGQLLLGDNSKLYAIVVGANITGLVDLDAGRPRWRIDCDNRGFALSPDGNLLALRGLMYTYIWDLRLGKLLTRFDTSAGYRAERGIVAFSPDGTLLATIRQDEDKISWPAVHLWDVMAGRIAKELQPNWYLEDLGFCSLRSMAFSPDGKTLATVYVGMRRPSLDDYTFVQLWDVISGAPSGRLPIREMPSSLPSGLVHHTHGYVPQVVFSGDGGLMVTGTFDGSLEVWHTGSLRKAQELKVASTSATPLSITPDNHALISFTPDNIYIHGINDGQELRSLTLNAGLYPCAATSNRLLLVAKDFLQVWKLDTDEIPERKWRPDGHTDAVRSTAFRSSPGVKAGQLFSGSRDGTIRVWDTKSKLEAQSLTMSDGSAGITRVVLNADGRTLAVSEGRLVRILDANSLVELETLANDSYPPRAIAFTQSGLLVAYRSDQTLHVWNASQQLELMSTKAIHQGHYVTAVAAFHPHGSMLASAGDSKLVYIWTLTNRSWLLQQAMGPLLHRLKGHNNAVESLAFSLDGQKLASGDWDGFVMIWETSKGKQVRAIDTRGTKRAGNATNRVKSVAFSPDGLMLATVTEDLRLWDVINGQQLYRSPDLHIGGIEAIAFNTDGDLLVTGHELGVIRIWRVR